MRIAIVGGGIFGSTTAWLLAKNNHSVDLYEKNKDIFMAASGINQFRLHRGYHYPRSSETIDDCLKGEKIFRQVYGNCVIDEPHDHYYGVAKEKSFLSAQECFNIWDKFGLEYKVVDDIDFINKDNFQKCVKVQEAIIDPTELKETCRRKMQDYGVNLFLNNEVRSKDLHNYDYTIVATYSLINEMLDKFPNAQKDYQFEVIEKLVFKFPDKFKDKSFVVQDGPFTCIDPLGKTGLSLMGNVVHAIHSRNIGKSPVIPKEFNSLINNGIIENPYVTNLDKFLDSAEVFFPGIKDEAIYKGSMFTIRTVLPNREHDDARPTIVEKIGDKLIVLFSGKIPTCIDASEEVLKIVNNAN